VKLTFGLALLLALAFGSTLIEPDAHAAPARTAFQIQCEEGINKTVSILLAQQSGYSVDNHLSFQSLTTMKGAARANSFVLGLTKTESRIAIGLDGAMVQDPSTGYECVAPQITVRLSYAPIVVYVGREFPPGSCGYDEILRHELRHVEAYMEHLPRVETLVRAALAQRFDGQPMYARSGSARAALKHEIDTGWLPYIKGEMGKVETQQAAIDTPAEYARLSRACNGEIQQQIKRARGVR
jgi:hypothetical protein